MGGSALENVIDHRIVPYHYSAPQCLPSHDRNSFLVELLGDRLHAISRDRKFEGPSNGRGFHFVEYQLSVLEVDPPRHSLRHQFGRGVLAFLGPCTANTLRLHLGFRETPEQAVKLLEHSSRVIEGLDDGKQSWKQRKAPNQLGVTRGTLKMA